MPLGFRQMAVDWWPASRLYSLAYAEGADVADLQRRTPLHVQLRRDKAGDRRAQAGSHPIDMFKIQRIEDKDGGSAGALRLRLRLQTIDKQKGYWLDTGGIGKASCRGRACQDG